MKQRTTAPSNNKYYIRKATGGLNGAVAGDPTVKGANVLENCFAGETRYVTNEGLKSFADTVGTVQNVLNENGEFVPAEIKSFGIQRLFKVEFSNGFYVYATENHRWVVDRFSSYKGKRYHKRRIKTTLNLNDGDYIPYNYYDGNGLLDKDGIVHGIVFGDGCKNANCSTYRVNLFGNKAELKKYLPEQIRSDYNLKEVPSIYESEEYLRGFVAGLLATDGSVTEDTFKISSIDVDALRQIENICYKIGVHIGGIYAETRDIVIGDYEYKDHTIYNLTLKRKGIECLLLKEADRCKLNSEFKDIKHTRIKSIESSNRVEEVYCAVEPQTHTITLENNILTGQCVGYANGRFNESINDPNLLGLPLPFRYQLVCNAENFIESAKAQGLSISPTPIEGGIMVWQKGATLKGSDGAGHVEFVEAVYDDGTIRCSSSGWKGWVFRTIIRTNANGRWGQDSRYKFRGCIINPSIENPKVVPVPPLLVDGIGGAATVSALQRYLHTEQDGVISGQIKTYIECFVPSLAAVQWGAGGSVCVKALQTWVGVDADGIWGQATSRALQKKLGVTPEDGIFGKNSMMALQTYLNGQLYPSEDKPPSEGDSEPNTSVPTIPTAKYTGELPSTHLIKTTKEVIEDTIKWAKWIAGDNDFHYGHGKDAHHNGCYFCGTQKLKMNHGIKMPEYTYCCNPLVNAAWAHGGCVPAALKLCRDCKSWSYDVGAGYDKSSLFKKVDSVKAGDVLCSNKHVALSIGNGKVVQASQEDNNVIGSESWKKSINIGTWKGYTRIYRFIGEVDTVCNIRYGEVGKRVERLQDVLKFLGYYSGVVDGLFGKGTLEAVKDFQRDHGLKVDGIVGIGTISVLGKAVA